jgi:hypothetical protein
MPELIACPVCGSPAILVNFGLPDKAWCQCVRNHAHGCIQGPVMPTRGEAAEAWNRLAGLKGENDELKTRVAELEAGLAQLREAADRLLWSASMYAGPALTCSDNTPPCTGLSCDFCDMRAALAATKPDADGD